MSSILVSSEANPDPWSDRPVPRLSNKISRKERASRS